MRSTLEARTAQVLDKIRGISWEYEPARYADETGDYLPDFVVRGLPCPLFIEVKGPPQTAEEEGEVRRQMIRVWASAPTAGLAIWTRATLDGSKFAVVRRGALPHDLAIARCSACGSRGFVNPTTKTRPLCRGCAAAADAA
jgi:hypothetical protein